jgi:phosphoglycolate phosphatase
VDFYRENLVFPIKDYYINIGMDFEKESFEELAVRYMDIYQAASLNAPLRVGVKDFLINQKKKGRKQILLSAAERNNLLEQTNHFGITDLFDTILGLDDIMAVSKIKLATGWLKNTGADPKEIVLIGDTLHDFEVAGALGCDCILLSGGHNSRERLMATQAVVLDTISELENFIQ